MKIGLGALIFLLCDDKELCYALFRWDASAEARDEFGAKITKVDNKVRLLTVIPCLSRFAKHY